MSRFLDHSSLAVTTTYLRRLEGQEDRARAQFAAAIRLLSALVHTQTDYRSVFTKRSSITSPRSCLRKVIVSRPSAVEAMVSIASQ